MSTAFNPCSENFGHERTTANYAKHLRAFHIGRVSGWLRCGLMLITLVVTNSASLIAQPATESTGATSQKAVTPEQVEQLRKLIEDTPDLDEDLKSSWLETCQKAAEAVTRAIALEEQTPRDQSAIDKAVERQKEQQAILDSKPELLANVGANDDLAQLMSALATRQPALQEARTAVTAAEAEITRRAERRTAIAADLAAHAKILADVEKEMQATAPPDEARFAKEVRRLHLLSKFREIQAQAPAWQAELSRYDAEKAVDLSGLRLQAARKRAAFLQQEIDELNQRIANRRRTDAAYVSQQLQAFASGELIASPYDPESSALKIRSNQKAELKRALKTAGLASSNVAVTTDVVDVSAQLNKFRKKLDGLRSLTRRTRDKIDRVGLTGAMGLELRRHLRDLDDVSEIRRKGRARQELMRDIEFLRFDLEDRVTDVRIEVDGFSDTQVPVDALQFRLAQDELTTLTTIEKNYGELFDRLGELDATEQEFVTETQSFETYIRERVLWIRSHRLPGREDVVDVAQTTRVLISGAHWLVVGQSLWSDVTDHLWLYVVLAWLLGVLFSVQPRFRRSLMEIGKSAERGTCHDFLPTIRAGILTLLLSLPWPALTGFLGWRLLTQGRSGDMTSAAGHGLLAATAGFMTLNVLRHLCRPSGLGLSHFAWPVNAVRLLRTRIYGLMVVLLPLLFLENLLHQLESQPNRDALERLIFLIYMLVLAQFQRVIFHPKSGVFRDFLNRHPSGWAGRLQWPFYWLIVAVPLCLAVLSAIGFFYTAFELSWRLHVITWVLIGLFVARSILMRWFVMRHREVRIEQSRQRRKTLQQAAETSDSSIPLPKEEAIDLIDVGTQTQRMIDSGLVLCGLLIMWFVWVDVLPALGILDRWELWPSIVEVTVESTDAEGVKTFRTEPRLEAITVADVLIALVIAVLAISSARNIPGLLEIAILNRLPLDAATRYAAQMVARYVIFVVGMVFAFGAIGVGWAKVQWLAAALTVGLGFGLQEIFANFISGLIILFERPVRIGDVVTIGEVSGTVSRIQIRATTITDWNRKEYIVPNKEFVTGRLLNWTLSDKTNRVVIEVGLAYGSDTQLARSLLLQAADSHPNVLKEPGPIATFETFGDSTLNLSLRCYLPDLDNRLQTITELHEMIDCEFKTAGLEIAFPQRDLHVRSMPETPTDFPPQGEVGR